MTNGKTREALCAAERLARGSPKALARARPSRSGVDTSLGPRITARAQPPTHLVPGENPALASTPQLVHRTCGADATLAYAAQDGSVAVLRYANNRWNAPVATGCRG